MNINKTYTHTFEISQGFYEELQKAYKTLNADSEVYDNFEDWLHDMVDYRILRHIRKNVEMHLDLKKHYTDLQQT